ncbi:MAG: hypothetical protein ACFFC1_13320 [Promethearchaeota archaeon]
MRTKILVILLLGFILVFLSALDLPYKVSKLKNPNSIEACGILYDCKKHKPPRGGGNDVPEPAGIILLISGLAGIGIYRYIRNNKK